ncbi:MAG: hypothetical protein ACK5N0_07025 [Synechococcaceae cyanobacterium]
MTMAMAENAEALREMEKNQLGRQWAGEQSVVGIGVALACSQGPIARAGAQPD